MEYQDGESDFAFSESFAESEATANNSFSQERSKGLLALLNRHIGKLKVSHYRAGQIKDEIDLYQKSQGEINEQFQIDWKLASNDLMQIKRQIGGIKQSLDECEEEFKNLSKIGDKFKFFNPKKKKKNHDQEGGHKMVNPFKDTNKLFQKFESKISSIIIEEKADIKSNFGEIFKHLKKDLFSIYTSKDFLIDTYLFANSKLVEMNMDLQERIKFFESESRRLLFCVNCHSYFNPKDNEDAVCFHHPGELKYYSCKSCGGDEYYTCCMKCMKCAQGCKRSKHRSMI